MPIGTVDYASTAPWNDPYNPWPSANTVYVSAVNINPAIYTVKIFNPNASAGSALITYGTGDADAFLYAKLSYVFFAQFQQYGWRFAPVTASLPYDYGLLTTARQVPSKSAGVSGDWIALFDVSTPEEIASLTVIPNFNDLTAWEFRKRRLLEIV